LTERHWSAAEILEQIMRKHGFTGLELVHQKYDELREWHGQIKTEIVPREMLSGYLAEELVKSDKILLIYENKSLNLFVIVGKETGDAKT